MAKLTDRLARRTTSGRYIPEVDGLRFVAISMVLFAHVQGALAIARGAAQVQPFGATALLHRRGIIDTVVGQGRFGVELFFILSGFILALPFAAHRLVGEKRVSMRGYFARRLTRLEPPYLVALLLCFIASGGVLVAHFGAGLGYLHGLLFAEPNRLNAAYWSLEVEIQFYILLPALSMVFLISDKLRRRTSLVLAIVLSDIAQILFVLHSARLSATVLGYMQFFLVGLLLADLYVADWRRMPAQNLRWDCVTLLGWPLFIWGARSTAFQYVGLPWVGLLLFFAALRGTFTRRALANRWVSTIGGMAYSIYLLHVPVMTWLERSTRGWWTGGSFDMKFGLMCLVFLPVVLATGSVYYVMVEQPCMDPNWAQDLRRRLRREHQDASLGLTKLEPASSPAA